MFDRPWLDPGGDEPTGDAGLSADGEPTDADRAVVDRILAVEAQQRADAAAVGAGGPWAQAAARVEALGSEVFGHEVFTRRAYAEGLLAVNTMVREVLAQDLGDTGRERSEAMEHAVHDVAAALGVTYRTAEIRVEDALLLLDDQPRTLAVLRAGYVPVPSARELARTLAGHPLALRQAAERQVLDTLGARADLELGTGDLDELALTARLEPGRVATVSLGASRGRVRDLAKRALRELGPLFAEPQEPDSAAVESSAEVTRPVPTRAGDVEFWPTRPGFVMVGSEMTEADATQVVDRNDHLARRSKRAGDARSLPELRGAWFRDLLLAEAGGQLAPRGGGSDDGDCPGVRPVPVHLTVHLLDVRTAADSERLGPISPETLSDLMVAARDTDGRIRVRPVERSECTGHPMDPQGELLDPGPYEVPAKLREAIIARDRTCVFPGCTVPARHCDLDHSIPHPRGPTCHCNLACVCRRHHRLKTSGRWRLVNHGQGRLTWISPTGRRYEVLSDPI